MPRKLRRAAALAMLVGSSLLATACVPALVRNRSAEPDVQPPASYPAPQPSTSAKDDLATRSWRDVFPSPALRGLIDEALSKNQELNLRIQELVILQNEASARHGEYRPKVRATVGVGADRIGKDTSQGVSDEANGLANPLGDFGFGLVGSWEVDVWGKLRAEAAAADARLAAGLEGRNFIVTQLVAEIARSYYDLLALDAQIAVLDRNIAIQNQALELIKVQKQAARVTELAVRRFEAEVLKNRSVRPQLEQERVQVQNRINFLVGRYPQAVERQVRELDAPLPPLLRAGVPSALLANRPDVRQAELALGAAKLDVKAARAAFYPALTIDARAGFRSFNPAHLLAIPESIAAAVGGGLTAPVLNRAAIEAEYRSADARQLAAVITYERAVLQAFTDVTNQLANLENVKAAYATRAKQVERLKGTVEMSTVLFKAARADYVEVLLVRRDLLEAEMEVIERRKLLQQAVVNLYQALGGGWRTATKAEASPGPS
jgi:NodT family efflux transporter outer membrane factor (OMF) lipoprotein